MTHKNECNERKEGPERKFMELNTYIRKGESSQVNVLRINLMKLEK